MHDIIGSPVPLTTPSLRLDAFTLAPSGPCNCCQAHPGDLTAWCADCSAEYLADRAAGHDWMGGIGPDGSPVAGFADHAESAEVIADYLDGLDGPGGYPADDEDYDLLRELAGDWSADGDGGDEERLIDAFGMSDLGWAAENLDPGEYPAVYSASDVEIWG